MIISHKIIRFFTILITCRTICCVNFIRTIEAVGYPYYKILFSLGTCKERVLFEDNKVWGSVRLNRVFDIYYKTDNSDERISKVEIKLVVNNTDCSSQSSTDVGGSEFAAVLVMPTNIGFIFYSLTIFSCNPEDNSKHYEEEYGGDLESYETF